MSVGSSNVAGARQALAKFPLDGFIALAEMMDNPQKRQEFVGELKKITEDLNTAIERVGKASEIERLLGEAKTERGSAAQALEDAETKAKAIVDAANATAGSLRKSLEDDRNKLDLAIKEFTNNRDSIETQLKTQNIALKDKEADFTKRNNLLKSKEEDVSKLKQELQTKLSGIRKAVEVG